MTTTVSLIIIVAFFSAYFAITYCLFYTALKLSGRKEIDKTELFWVTILLGCIGGFAIAFWCVGIALMFKSYRPTLLKVYDLLTGHPE